jgi:hypothetical protein
LPTTRARRAVTASTATSAMQAVTRPRESSSGGGILRNI